MKRIRVHSVEQYVQEIGPLMQKGLETYRADDPEARLLGLGFAGADTEILISIAEFKATGKMPLIPPPLNLFMNIPVATDGTLSFQPSLAPPGSHVALRSPRRRSAHAGTLGRRPRRRVRRRFSPRTACRQMR